MSLCICAPLTPYLPLPPIPQWVEDNLAVMSTGFLLESVEDAVMWRGPNKNGGVRVLLTRGITSSL